jgi:hypothetical protein
MKNKKESIGAHLLARVFSVGVCLHKNQPPPDPKQEESITRAFLKFNSQTWQGIDSVREMYFFFNLCGGTLGTAVTTSLLYQPRMIGDGDCGEIGGIKIGRGNRSTRRKPAPAPLFPPQIPSERCIFPSVTTIY